MVPVPIEVSQARTDFETAGRSLVNAIYDFHASFTPRSNRRWAGHSARPFRGRTQNEQEDEVGILGTVVVAGVAIFATTAARRGEKPTEVRIEAVDSRDLVASVTASGQVQPRTKVDVAADISGRIVELAVKEGQMVNRGDFLLQIDPEQYEAAVQRAEAGLSSAKAQAAQARAHSSRPSAATIGTSRCARRTRRSCPTPRSSSRSPDGSERGPARGVHT